MTTKKADALLNAIRNALGPDQGQNMSALSIALVEQALSFKRNDGTVGNADEVKAFLNQMTNGMVDLCQMH